MTRRLAIVSAIALATTLLCACDVNASTGTLPKVARTPAAASAPGDHTIDVTVQGRTRVLILHVPALSVRNRPLILVYHGALDTASGTEQSTDFAQVSNTNGELVAFMQGYENTWNEGAGHTPAEQAGIDDVAYTAAAIASARAARDVQSRADRGHGVLQRRADGGVPRVQAREVPRTDRAGGRRAPRSRSRRSAHRHGRSTSMRSTAPPTPRSPTTAARSRVSAVGRPCCPRRSPSPAGRSWTAVTATPSVVVPVQLDHPDQVLEVPAWRVGDAPDDRRWCPRVGQQHRRPRQSAPSCLRPVLAPLRASAGSPLVQGAARADVVASWARKAVTAALKASGRSRLLAWPAPSSTIFVARRDLRRHVVGRGEEGRVARADEHERRHADRRQRVDHLACGLHEDASRREGEAPGIVRAASDLARRRERTEPLGVERIGLGVGPSIPLRASLFAAVARTGVEEQERADPVEGAAGGTRG